MCKMILFASTVVLAIATFGPARAADIEGLPGDYQQIAPGAKTCLKDLQAFDELSWKAGSGALPHPG